MIAGCFVVIERLLVFVAVEGIKEMVNEKTRDRNKFIILMNTDCINMSD